MTETLKSSIKTHAIREKHQNKDDVDFHVEEIKRIGFTQFQSGLSEAELDTVRAKVDEIYQKQIEEVGGEEVLEKIHDANVVRSLLVYDEIFLRIATHPMMIAIGKKFLGEYFTLMSQNALVNKANLEHYQITWHRDLNYQHFVSSRPLAISFLYCIDPFTDETGPTHVLPASHKWEDFPSDEYVQKHEQPLLGTPGTILAFDAMLFHRAGSNISGKNRIALNHIYTVPSWKPQISFPKMLQGKYRDDPFLSYFLGYESQVGESVKDWRSQKINPSCPSKKN